MSYFHLLSNHPFGSLKVKVTNIIIQALLSLTFHINLVFLFLQKTEQKLVLEGALFE